MIVSLEAKLERLRAEEAIQRVNVDLEAEVDRGTTVSLTLSVHHQVH